MNVTEDITLSVHRHIQFLVAVAEEKKKGTAERRGVGIDRNKLNQAMRRRLTGNATEQGVLSADALTKIIKGAQEAAAHSKDKINRSVPYWWNDAVTDRRQECISLRRAFQRARNRGGLGEIERLRLESNLREAKRTLVREIRAAKRASWKDLCSKLNDDIWGQGYKIAIRHLRGLRPNYTIAQERRDEIIRELFPQHQNAWERLPRDPDPPLFTEEDLRTAADRLKSGTAPEQTAH